MTFRADIICFRISLLTLKKSNYLRITTTLRHFASVKMKYVHAVLDELVAFGKTSAQPHTKLCIQFSLG